MSVQQHDQDDEQDQDQNHDEEDGDTGKDGAQDDEEQGSDDDSDDDSDEEGDEEDGDGEGADGDEEKDAAYYKAEADKYRALQDKTKNALIVERTKRKLAERAAKKSTDDDDQADGDKDEQESEDAEALVDRKLAEARRLELEDFIDDTIAEMAGKNKAKQELVRVHFDRLFKTGTKKEALIAIEDALDLADRPRRDAEVAKTVRKDMAERYAARNASVRIRSKQAATNDVTKTDRAIGKEVGMAPEKVAKLRKKYPHAFKDRA